MKQNSLIALCLMFLAAPGWAGTLEAMRKAAAQGDARAQDELGQIYEEGRGVPRDYAEAVKWYRKAAEQGNDQAQFHLGWMYLLGYGVPPNERKAEQWFAKAVEQARKAAAQEDAAAQGDKHS